MLTLLTACAEKHDDATTHLSVEQQMQWQTHSAKYFLGQGLVKARERDTLAFAQALNAVLANAEGEQADLTPNDTLNGIFTHLEDSLENSTQSSTQNSMQKAKQGAKQERLLAQLKLYYAHEAFSFDYTEQAVPKALALPRFQRKLEPLKQDYPVLSQGAFSIYAADSQQAVLAYSRIKGKERAFIAFNMSFDTHEMPLPFGFMASTKVLMWEAGLSREFSDSELPEVDSFVTSSPIMLKPFSVVLLMVGVQAP